MRLGMTQEQVANYIDVSTVYIGFVERGERSVTLEKLLLLAECFHVSIDSFLSETSAEKTLQNKEERLLDLWESTSEDEQDLIISIAEAVVGWKEMKKGEK